MRLIGALTIAALAACGGQADQEGADMAMSGMDNPMAADSVALTAKNESGITGNAVLAEAGDSVTVTVMLRGATAGAAYPNHVHHGTCDSPGGVAAPLTSVTAGSDGTGTATTTVARAAVEGDAKLVQVHLPGGQTAACGEIS